MRLGLPFYFQVGLNNIYSEKVHDIHKYNVKIVGSDSKRVAYLDHLLDMSYFQVQSLSSHSRTILKRSIMR